MLAFADAGDQRRAAARADDMAGLIAAHDRDRVSAMKALRRADDRTQQSGAFVHRLMDQVRDDFGIGVRIEAVAMRLELFAKRGVVLDDAVVDDRDAVVGDVRMRVDRVRHAVRRPARVRDAGEAFDRRLLVKLLEIANLAGRADTRQAVAFEDRDAGGIVAAVFERLEAGDQDRDDVFPRGGGDDSAHIRLFSLPRGTEGTGLRRRADDTRSMAPRRGKNQGCNRTCRHFLSLLSQAARYCSRLGRGLNIDVGSRLGA